jgi:DNA polymerase III epsilon subunit family exonuclease
MVYKATDYLKGDLGMSKTLNQKARCFFDIESTGLNAGEQEILSLAIVRIEPDGTRSVYETKIKPVRIENATAFALKMNKYSDEAWADAPLFSEVADQVTALLRGTVVIGHNVKFDLGFMDAELKIAGAKGFSRNEVDTMTLAYEHLAPIGLEALKLDTIREFLGWSKDGAHTALFDAETCERLYNLLAGSGWWTKTKIKFARRFNREVK